MKKLFKIIFIFFSLAGFAWFFEPILCGVKNIGNIFGLALCALVFAVTIFWEKIILKCKKSKGVRIFCRTVFVLFGIGILWTAVLTGCILYGANAFNNNPKPPEDVTVVVLGSKVNGTEPSADLRERINAASEFLRQNPSVKCIASGGKGAGEQISEAEAIRTSLIENNIEPSRILVEDKSKSTTENLKNSLNIINDKNLSKNVAIVTDEYHQFRAGKMASSIGLNPYPVNAATPSYIFSACYARELLALTNFLLLGNLLS